MTAKTLKDPLNSSGIEPLGNRILIQPDLMDEYSEGGIYIREQDRERHDSSASYGYVVAMGSDAFTHSISVTKRMIDGGFTLIRPIAITIGNCKSIIQK